MSRMSVHKGKLIHRWPGDVRMCAIDSPHNTGEPSQGMKIHAAAAHSSLQK